MKFNRMKWQVFKNGKLTNEGGTNNEIDTLRNLTDALIEIHLYKNGRIKECFYDEHGRKTLKETYTEIIGENKYKIEKIYYWEEK